MEAAAVGAQVVAREVIATDPITVRADHRAATSHTARPEVTDRRVDIIREDQVADASVQSEDSLETFTHVTITVAVQAVDMSLTDTVRQAGHREDIILRAVRPALITRVTHLQVVIPTAVVRLRTITHRQ